MLQDKDSVQAQGAYALPRYEGKTVLIKVPQEDLGKVEGDSTWTELLPVVQGMFGIVTGKVEAGETVEEALSRELNEEQSIEKSPALFTNGLPTASIRQVRAGEQVLFFVSGHQFPLLSQDVAYLQQHTHLQEVADAQLDIFLKENASLLRPSVYAILTLLYQYLEKGGRL